MRLVRAEIVEAKKPNRWGDTNWAPVSSLRSRVQILRDKYDDVQIELAEWEDEQASQRLSEGPATPEQRHLKNVADAELCPVRDCEPYLKRWCDLLDLEVVVEDGAPRLQRRDQGLRLVEG